MKCWAHGKEKIYYSYSLANKILKSRTTIKKAFEELEDNKFIKKKLLIRQTYIHSLNECFFDSNMTII